MMWLIMLRQMRLRINLSHMSSERLETLKMKPLGKTDVPGSTAQEEEVLLSNWPFQAIEIMRV